MEKYIKDNCIITIENGNKFILILCNSKEKKQALQDIKNNNEILYGCSEDLTNEEFEYYKNKGFTIIEL